jgi:FMN phosphatase YigB (HAD superfamily)
MGILEDAGFATERAAVDAAMASSWDTFLQRWRSNEQYTHVEAAVEIVEHLGFVLPPGVHDALVESFTVATSNRPSLTEGIGDCLRALDDAGVRLGIICDVGMTPSVVLRQVLEHEGLLPLFDHWSFSDEVGCYKPDRLIFEHALAGLGSVPPSRAAHVGDLKRTDVAGALGVGMTAVRYTGAFDDVSEGAEATVVVASHADLPAALGFISA